MALVSIDSGPIEATDRLSNVPRKSWRSLMLARRHFLQVNLSYDCRCLVEFVNDAREMYRPLGFASVSQMIRDGYGLEPAEIGIAIEWLRINPPDDPVPLDQAVKLGKHGGKRTKGQAGESSLKWNTKTHWLARLERDRPDLAMRVRGGDLSANAAAIEAGFRKKLTPLESICKMLSKLSDDELEQLEDEINRRINRRLAE